MAADAGRADARTLCKGSYSSWLTKVKSEGGRGKWISSTNKRYFTIDFDAKVVFYSHSASQKKVSQPIRFREISWAERLPPNKKRKGCGFILNTIERSFELYSTTNTDAVQWVHALNAAKNIGKGKSLNACDTEINAEAHAEAHTSSKESNAESVVDEVRQADSDATQTTMAPAPQDEVPQVDAPSEPRRVIMPRALPSLASPAKETGSWTADTCIVGQSQQQAIEMANESQGVHNVDSEVVSTKVNAPQDNAKSEEEGKEIAEKREDSSLNTEDVSDIVGTMTESHQEEVVTEAPDYCSAPNAAKIATEFEGTTPMQALQVPVEEVTENAQQVEQIAVDTTQTDSVLAPECEFQPVDALPEPRRIRMPKALPSLASPMKVDPPKESTPERVVGEVRQVETEATRTSTAVSPEGDVQPVDVSSEPRRVIRPKALPSLASPVKETGAWTADTCIVGQSQQHQKVDIVKGSQDAHHVDSEAVSAEVDAVQEEEVMANGRQDKTHDTVEPSVICDVQTQSHQGDWIAQDPDHCSAADAAEVEAASEFDIPVQVVQVAETETAGKAQQEHPADVANVDAELLQRAATAEEVAATQACETFSIPAEPASGKKRCRVSFKETPEEFPVEVFEHEHSDIDEDTSLDDALPTGMSSLLRKCGMTSDGDDDDASDWDSDEGEPAIMKEKAIEPSGWDSDDDTELGPSPVKEEHQDACGAPKHTVGTFVEAKPLSGTATKLSATGDLDDLVGLVLGEDSAAPAPFKGTENYGFVPRFHCTACDFQVMRIESYTWTKQAAYMFFRNNYPNIMRLRKNLTPSKGCCAYCCQCSWKSADAAADITDVAEGLRWKIIKG